MTVKELKEKLKKLPDDMTVKTWNASDDEETDKVIVSTDSKTTVWIMDVTIGFPRL